MSHPEPDRESLVRLVATQAKKLTALREELREARQIIHDNYRLFCGECGEPFALIDPAHYGEDGSYWCEPCQRGMGCEMCRACNEGVGVCPEIGHVEAVSAALVLSGVDVSKYLHERKTNGRLQNHV